MFRFVSSRQRSVMIYRSTAAAAAVLMAGAYASAQTQLLLNPSFEAGIDGSPNSSGGDQYMGPSAGPWYSWDNWAYDPVKNPNAEAFYTSEIPAHSGTQVGKTYGGQNGGIYQYVNINPYDAYTASAWFYNFSGDALETAETDDVRLAAFYDGPNGTGNQIGGPAISDAKVSSSTPQNTWVQLTKQAAAPAGTESMQWMAFFNNPDYLGGSMFVDDGSLLDTSWNGGGTTTNWSDNNNWGGGNGVTGVAPGQYAPVVFAGTNKLTSINDTAAGTPYYGIAFTPTAGAYTVNGDEANLASDVDNYSPNTQTINLGLGMQQNTNFNAQAGNLVINGIIGGAFALTADGPFTLTLGGKNTYSGGTNVTEGTVVIGVNGGLPTGTALNITGGTVQLGTSTGLATISSLAISGNGTLDVNNNHVIINYAGGPDPISSIVSLLKTGYNGGNWNGGGIDSSAVAANNSVSGNLLYGVGYADSADAGNPAGLASGTIEIAYTLLGDANLSGVVDGTDFGIVAANFNKGVTGWDQGDFNYDNVVDGTDFGDLAANFNKGASGAAAWQSLVSFAAANGLLADVPEPASAGLILVGAASLLARRRGRKGGGSV